jgi:hypothetical protein
MTRMVVTVIAFACVLAKATGTSRAAVDMEPPSVFVGSSSVTVGVQQVSRPAPSVGRSAEKPVRERVDSAPRPRLVSAHGCVGYDRWGNPR